MLGQSDYFRSQAYQFNFCTECWAVTGAKQIHRIYHEITIDLAERLSAEFIRIEKIYKSGER
jgi:hypothetical protein